MLLVHLVHNLLLIALFVMLMQIQPVIVVLLVFENEDIDGRMERVEKYIPVLDES